MARVLAANVFSSVPRVFSGADDDKQPPYPTTPLEMFHTLVDPVISDTTIGRNHPGQWVARQQNGLYGGLFVNRAQAVKYALFENGQHPEMIVELSREIELDMRSQTADIPASRVA